jgi:hypothetical protein
VAGGKARNLTVGSVWRSGVQWCCDWWNVCREAASAEAAGAFTLGSAAEGRYATT